jgi:hypothetical protein
MTFKFFTSRFGSDQRTDMKTGRPLKLILGTAVVMP